MHDDNRSDSSADGAETIVRRHRPGGGGAPRPSQPPPAVESQTISERGAALAAERTGVDAALFTQEAVRSRGFSIITLFMVTVVAVELPWLAGTPRDKLPMALALAVMFAAGAYSFVCSSEARYSVRVFRIQGWVLSTGMVVVLHYVGFFSPITVVLSLGIYYLGQASDRPHALALPCYVTFTWLVGSLLVMAGVIDDGLLYRVDGVTTSSRIFMLIGVTCSMLATFWLARLSQKSVREAIEASNRAALLAQQRDALLDEAHGQLDRAMRAVVGKPGRYSGAVAGSFRLDEVIGVGAMGEVYAGEHVGDGRRAGVKLLHQDALQRDDMVSRFLREADVCRRFDHENLVRVHEVGRLPDGSPYMAMERLDGSPLSVILRERGRLSDPEVRELAHALAAGLTHAHDKGVIHRDLKPHNIVHATTADARPAVARWTILDFGISRLVDATGTLTREGVVGTPAYMSPEQARSQPLDPRSDVFALGSVLYRVLTGRPAFPGTDTPRIMFDVAYCMPARPSQQVEGLHPDVDLMFAVAMAKDPDRRFRGAGELAAALAGALDGKLADATRERGRDLLRESPWGYRPHGRT